MMLFVSFISLHASANTNKIEVTAKSLYTTKNTVHADEGVIVYYDKSIIKSEHASYNKETKLLVLDGNVEMIGYKGSKEHTDHMEIHTDTKEVAFKKLFLTGENDVWLLSDTAHKKDGNYILGRSILSSCSVDDPLWHMGFSDSVYDSEEHYMKVYNAKVYFKDVPIFYSPYLAFSTNKERSSGLLFPSLGYTQTEGFLYEQPIFWAISPSMDLELNPQIRTERSTGLYTTLRFVDSNTSSGKLRVGYFKDKPSYIAEFKPKNETHYGIEFNYESSEVFKKYLPADFTDELYVNTTYLNDIDYINLQKSQLRHFGLSSLQESRINYFAYNHDYYMGINAKYFIDTKEKDNDATLQILPSMQWHKYLDHIIWDNLTYSADVHVQNITRKKGVTLKQAEIKVPIEYSTSFFDDFITLSLSEEFYYSKSLFANGEYEHDNFQYAKNTHKMKVFTDLTKKYDDFMHVILPSLSYVKPANERQSPVTFDKLEKKQRALSPAGQEEEQYDFSVNQYIYNNKAKLKFFQRFSQKYFPGRENKLDDMSNEMGYYWRKWKFHNHVVYSHEFNEIRAIASEVAIRKDNYKFRLGHNYNQKLTEKEHTVKTNNINLDFGYVFDEKISLGGGVIYDLLESENTQWKASVGYHRDCWSFDASVGQGPRPTSSGYENEMTYYLQLNFIPFGAVGTDNIK